MSNHGRDGDKDPVADDSFDDGAQPITLPAHAYSNRHQQRQDLFMGVSLRGWAISAISLVAVLTAIGGGFFTVYGKYQASKTTVETQSQTNTILLDQNKNLEKQLKPVAATTHAKLTEAQKHLKLKDHFETFPMDDDPEVIAAEYYPSDGCIHITRKDPHAAAAAGQASAKNKVFYGQYIQDEWILDPNKVAASATSDVSIPDSTLDLNAAAIKSVGWELEKGSKEFGKSEKPKLVTASAPKLKRAAMYQGSCMNPHPGTFQVRNLQINACEVQVTRIFIDGCSHYQMYNACTGQWAQGVVWTYCNMQHRW